MLQHLQGGQFVSMDSRNNRPLIQVGDEMREMTDEEYAQYLIDQTNVPALYGVQGET